MSEYLTYTLWRNREERLPHELERRRAAHERLEAQEQLLSGQAHEQLLAEHRPAPEPPGALGSLPESAGPSTASTGASDRTLVPSAASPVSSEVTAELEHQLVER